MTYTANDIAKVQKLVQAGVDMLRSEGWSDEQIKPRLRFMADEAIAFLLRKQAA